jgi:hypothetical protein
VADLSGLAADMMAFEDAWDQRLGGFAARGHRELLAYIVGRLLGVGASLDDVLAYQRAVVERYIVPATKPGAAS